MRKALATTILVGSMLTFGSTASAFQCPTDFAAADAAIESATAAMKAMSDTEQMGLGSGPINFFGIPTLIDI